MKCKDLIWFWGFLLEKGKGKFGSGDEAKFLQSSSWGKVGSSFDAFWSYVWMDHNDKELKRARGNKDPLQTDENI